MSKVTSKIASLFSGPASPNAMAARQREEGFNKHIVDDTQTVLNKLLAALGTDLKELVGEVQQQNNEFYHQQMVLLEDRYKAEMQLLNQEVEALNKQQLDTVEMYNLVVAEMNDKARSQTILMEQKEREHKEEVERLTGQLQASEATLADTCKTYKQVLQDMNKQLQASQQSQQTSDLKSQKNKLVLVQTVDAQQKEIDNVKEALRKSEEQRAELEAKCQKLTTVTQALLAKHQQARRSQDKPSSASTHGALTSPLDSAALALPLDNVTDDSLSSLLGSPTLESPSSMLKAMHAAGQRASQAAGPSPPPPTLHQTLDNTSEAATTCATPAGSAPSVIPAPLTEVSPSAVSKASTARALSAAPNALTESAPSTALKSASSIAGGGQAGNEAAAKEMDVWGQVKIVGAPDFDDNRNNPSSSDDLFS